MQLLDYAHNVLPPPPARRWTHHMINRETPSHYPNVFQGVWVTPLQRLKYNAQHPAQEMSQQDTVVCCGMRKKWQFRGVYMFKSTRSLSSFAVKDKFQPSGESSAPQWHFKITVLVFKCLWRQITELSESFMSLNSSSKGCYREGGYCWI